jgi:hypothetical protein
MINAHDLREMAAFVKNEPGVIEGVKAELTSAALTGEDSTILNGVAAPYVEPLKLYLESCEYDVILSEPDANSHSVDMIVSWKIPEPDDLFEQSAEPEFSISSKDFLKRFELGKEWEYGTSPAITLNPMCLSDRFQTGWTLRADINDESGFSWINEFEATHPEYGKVYGDLEKSLYYNSEEGLKNFVKTYKVCIEFWDYKDI